MYGGFSFVLVLQICFWLAQQALYSNHVGRGHLTGNNKGFQYMKDTFLSNAQIAISEFSTSFKSSMRFYR